MLTVIGAHPCFVGERCHLQIVCSSGLWHILSQEWDKVKGCLNTDVKSQWAGKTIYLDYEQNLYSGPFTSMLIVTI